jgi:hypothetical protein
MSPAERLSADLDAARSKLKHTKSLSEDRGFAEQLEEAISNPGSVKINVKGAFIIDDEPTTKNSDEGDGIHYERKDIRLPHHTGVVSHVAVDVCVFCFSCLTVAFTSIPRILGSSSEGNLLRWGQTNQLTISSSNRLADRLPSWYISQESCSHRTMAGGSIL